MIDDAEMLYKDHLNKLQDLDEERVKFIKNSLETFFSSFQAVGYILNDKLAESINSVQLLNPDTDIKIFIDENRSTEKFYKK